MRLMDTIVRAWSQGTRRAAQSAGALGIGMLVGLMVTPLALFAVEALGMRARGEMMLPLIAGAAAVMLTAAIACTPSLIQAARVAPAELLRRD
jgi:hypothetical protein